MLQKVYVKYNIFFSCIVVYGVDSPSVRLAVRDSGVKVLWEVVSVIVRKKFTSTCV